MKFAVSKIIGKAVYHKKASSGRRGRPGRRVLAGVFFLAGAALLQAAARNAEGFGQWYAVTVYPVLVGSIGRICGIFPFSVSEIGLYFFLLGMLWYGIRHIRRPIQILKSVFFAASLLFFLYTVNCGINYYRDPFSSYLEQTLRESSLDELQSLCRLLEEKTAQAAEFLLEEGTFIPDAEEKRQFPVMARQAMERLGEEYPQLAGDYPNPKPLILSQILSFQSLSGIYSPFTIEANYNDDMTAYNIPHTACHELSHLRGFMREDEANFIGFLACIRSDVPYFAYSGYLTAYVYAHNALYRQDAGSAMEIYALLPEEVLSDLSENNAFWKQYEGKISEASTRINDTYLKANSQTEGVQSYGRMVDLLLSYYRGDLAAEQEND